MKYSDVHTGQRVEYRGHIGTVTEKLPYSFRVDLDDGTYRLLFAAEFHPLAVA